MSLLADLISGLLLLGGGFFMIVGGIGVIRMPDVYTRLHAASITDTLGAGMILLGLMFQAGFNQITIKLILILIFLLYTSPTSGYALARAALTDNDRVDPILDQEPPSSDT